jgi:outer membrane protein assembly factor BamB
MRFNVGKVLTLLSVILCILSCKKSPPPKAKSYFNFISTFSLSSTNNPGLQGTIFSTIKGDSIFLTIPSTLNITSLVPDIDYLGVAINPANHQPQDFSKIVKYTVTAEDGSSRVYTVKARYLASDKEIVSFGFNVSNNPILDTDIKCSISGDTIMALVNPGINFQQLIPVISFKGVSINPDINAIRDFSNPVTYTVTAEDGTTKNYTVILSHNKSIFVGSSNGVFYCLNAGTGSSIWEYNGGSAFANPTYHNNRIYVPMQNGTVVALDSKTGSLIWQTQLDAGSFNNPVVQDGYLCFTEVISNNLGKVYVLDENTGTVFWEKPFYGYAAALVDPSIYNGIVYVPSYVNGIYAYYLISGDTAWYFPSQFVKANPLILDNTIIIGGIAHIFSACSPATGALEWASNTSGNPVCSPVFANGLLYCGSYESIYGLSSTDGHPVWTFNYAYSGEVHSITYTKNIILGTYVGGHVTGLDANTGTALWELNTTKPYTNLAAANGIAYLGLLDGTLWCFDAVNGKTKWGLKFPGFVFSNPIIVDAANSVSFVASSGNQQ